MSIFPKMSQQCVVLLQESYKDATRRNGLIEFTNQIRTNKNDLTGKYSVKQSQLDHLFSQMVWKTVQTKSGHRKMKHTVTDVTIEYSNHSNNIDPGAVETIFDKIQEHLNILCNQIFDYRSKNWKTQPNYTEAATRYELWKTSQN